jgi:general secretion pathway protein I
MLRFAPITVRSPGKKLPRGISLLETLAALVILSAGAAVMLTWFSQNATALGRLKESEDIERGRLQAIEFARSINPVENPTGEVELANYRVSWSSRQTANTVRALNAMGAPGKYEVSLFELDIQLKRAGDAPSASATQILLPVAGYKIVGDGGSSFFGGPAN